MARLSEEQYHVPVMLTECMDLLSIRCGYTYADATLGGGGHSAEILKRIEEQCARSTDQTGLLISTDADEVAIAKCTSRFAEYLDVQPPLFKIVHANFSELPSVLEGHILGGVLFDLGVSSFQFDHHERGFSFRANAPLDMRFTPTGKNAADIVNTYSEAELTDIFYRYAEDPSSRRIAKVIVQSRNLSPIYTTFDLRELVVQVVPTQHQSKTMARIFQALRIEVNNELQRLESTLHRMIQMLAPTGRIVVMSYHSLEDGIVKNVFKEYSDASSKVVSLLTKKPITPSANEVSQNPRSRSARLRAIERL
ncbi:MAG: 16S rRNA (cytosine(1402)-N(4))-methyltransferase RsmH [Ignavibacteria bacterium]|nr:16S rRNA (cytosine(1402)-N(4))-methyltransferase RsmH [Ignavibacteria bacterium]